MFDLMAQAMIAWNQVGLLIAAGLLGGFGGLLVGSRIYSRSTATRVSGTIIGVRQTDRGLYYPVYRYTSPAGEGVEATSDTASNATSRMHTGRTVALLVSEANPSRAAEADSYVGEIVGAILIAAGVGVGYFAFTAWPVTKLTWFVMAAMVIYAAMRLKKSLRPQEGPRSVSAWRKQRQQQLEASPVRPVEDFSSASNAGEQRKLSPVLPPVFVILGVGMLAASLHVGHAVMRLGSSGQRAPGTVVQLQADSDSDHRTVYHAVVRFSPGDGSPVEFKDHFGSNPPAYHTHDAVTVLYAPSSPQGTAIVDRGLWNWIPAGALCLFGVILAVAGVQLRRNSTPATRPEFK